MADAGRSRAGVSGFAVILAYFAATLALPALGTTSFVTEVVTAPLYFLIPIGFGLFLLALPGAANPMILDLSRAQLLPLAYIIGVVSVTMVFEYREWSGHKDVDKVLVFAGIHALAVIGYYRARSIFIFDDSFRFAAKVFLSVLPVLAIIYGIRYLVFAEFPLRDLFQETHFMKVAVEFARFDRLNPFTADSYVPIIPVLNGLLSSYYGYDLLRAQWVFPVFTAMFQALVLYALMSSVFEDRNARWVAAAIAITLLTSFTATNGDIAALGTLLILSLLCTGVRTAGCGREAALRLGALLLVLLVAFKVDNFDTAKLFVLVALASSSGVLAGRRFAIGAPWVAAGLLVVAMASLHRSTMLFVPTVLAGIALYALVFWSAWFATEKRRAALLLSAGLVLPAAAALWLVLIVSAEWGYTVIAGDMAPLFDLLTQAILGNPITSSTLQLGYGSNRAALEWARGTTPLMILLTAILFLIFATFLVRLLRGGRSGTARDSIDRSVPEVMLVRLSWTWLWAWAVVLGILSGFPFAYRISFFPISLLAIVASDLLCFGYRVWPRDRQSLRVLRSLPFVLLGYSLIAGIGFYQLRISPIQISHEYLRWLHPVSLTLLAALGAGCLLSLTIRRAFLCNATMVACLLLALLLDRESVRARWMDYSYGETVPAEATAITHYTLADLALADKLSERPERTILVSDPYTLSILRARTGFSGIVTYSNLDSMNQISERLLKTSLRVLTAPNLDSAERHRRYCLEILKLLQFGSAELSFAVMAKDGTPAMVRNLRDTYTASLSDNLLENITDSEAAPLLQGWVKDMIGSERTPWTIVTVLTKKTLAWSDLPRGETAGYFPRYGVLDPTIVSENIGETFSMIENMDNRAIAFESDCRADWHGSAP